jgi:ribosomal protein S18 acetylase RimI-like enzyme
VWPTGRLRWRRIEYETAIEGLAASDLDGFFAGWTTPPTREVRLAHLRGCEHVVLARDAESGRVVGFVSAVGDGVFSAFIPLLEVLPAYRGRGIGTELVRRMLELLEGRYMVDLGCDDDLVPFYERLGMQRWVGMGLRDAAALREE